MEKGYISFLGRGHFWKSKIFLLVLMSMLLTLSRTSHANINSDSMLGYWKFDGNPDDSSGHLHAGTLNGPAVPNFSTNKAPLEFTNSQSLRFDASNGNVTFSNQTGLRPTSALTLSFWLWLDSYPQDSVPIAGNFDTAYLSTEGFFFSVESGSVRFHTGNGQSSSSCAISLEQFPLNTWVHLSGTWDGSVMKIWRNGTSQNSTAFSGPISYSGGSQLKISNLTGKIDDMRLYGRALSAIEIASLGSGEHTQAIWTGANGSDYQLAANWNTNSVPDPYTEVVIANASQQPEMSADEQLAGLNILNGANLNLHAHDLIMNDQGTFSNEGTLSLDNASAQTFLGFSNDTNSGTIAINNLAASTNLRTGGQYHNLTLNASSPLSLGASLVISGNLTFTGSLILGGNLVVGGNLNFSEGTLDAGSSSHSIYIAGNWNNTSGNFNAREGTVTFNGGDQTIFGSNNFWNLTKINSGTDRFGFEAGKTQVIENNLTLEGGVSRLYLRSSSPGTQWSIDARDTLNLSNLDVKDSNNINGTAIETVGHNIQSSGNNSNWIFDESPPTIALTGTVDLTSSGRPAITGIASDPMSNISSVHLQIDSTSGTWTACTPNDGTFDQPSEYFTCRPNSVLEDGTHIMNIQATDSELNLTSHGDFISVSFTVDKAPPSILISEPGAIANIQPTFSASLTDSFANTASAQFQIDNLTETWVDCSASDGAFDSLSEKFTCTAVSALSEGTHTLYLRSSDCLGNITSLSSIKSMAFIIDITGPKISSVSASTEDNSAKITWTTDEKATSTVEYGKTTAYGNTASPPVNVAGALLHSVSVSGLSSCETYHYRTKSKDSAGNETVSSDFIMKTGGCCSRPDAPKLRDAETIDNASIRLYWEDVPGPVSRYSMQYGTKPGDYPKENADIGEKRKEQFLVRTLAAGTTYYFRIRATNDCGKGEWSSVVTAKTKDILKEEAVPSTQVPATGQTSETPSPSIENQLPENSQQNFNGNTSAEWQIKYFGNPYCYTEDVCGSGSDPDHDGLTNSDEFRLNTDPKNADSDKDGITDSTEIETGYDPTISSKETGGKDKISYESPKETGRVDKENYQVNRVEMIEEGDGKKKIKIEGNGPPDSFVTIFVYSDLPKVLTIKTDSSGNWTYTVDDLENGEHQVYVAVTDNIGKISAKSEPLSFVKTAEAVSVVTPVSASSSVEKRYPRDIMTIVIVAIIGLFLALIALGFVIKSRSKNIRTDQ